MRRFRFGLDPYLGLLRQQQSAAESTLMELRDREATLRSSSDRLVAKRDESFAVETSQRLAAGEDLAALDRWRSRLSDQAVQCRQEAEEVLKPIAEAQRSLSVIQRRVKLVERLRESQLTAHQKRVDRQVDTEAAELFLSQHRRDFA